MSINSLDHEEMKKIATKWEGEEGAMPTSVPSKDVKSAAARRRIETLRDIRESGLTIEEAKELGLIH